jgi:hypothetical protein
VRRYILSQYQPLMTGMDDQRQAMRVDGWMDGMLADKILPDAMTMAPPNEARRIDVHSCTSGKTCM